MRARCVTRPPSRSSCALTPGLDLPIARVCARPSGLPGHAHCGDEGRVSLPFSPLFLCSRITARLTRPHLSARRYKTFYPDGPEKSQSFSRIVTTVHAARIKGLLDETKGTIVLGGGADVENRYIAPTVVANVREDDSLLSECVPFHALLHAVQR